MDKDGEMFNLFLDADGEPQRVPIGNINELVTLDNIKQVRRLQRSTKWSERRSRRQRN